MAVAKRNLEEIGESLENMGMNDRPSLLNTEMAKSEDRTMQRRRMRRCWRRMKKRNKVRQSHDRHSIFKRKPGRCP